MSLDKDKDLQELIHKVTLLNAIKHNGIAQSGSIIGKIIVENKDLKNRIRDLSKLINQIVLEVNLLTIEEQINIIKKKWPNSLKKNKTKESKELPPLENVEKYKQIVTRFSPNPDCVLHLGSARAIILSYEYARKYNGKFILRFEDTDPKIKKPIIKFYKLIRDDLAWLGCEADIEYIQSDRIPIYYEYTKMLLSNGQAYVCECAPDDFRKKIIQNEPCSCRETSKKENLENWKRMLEGGYTEGEAVVRLKTDLSHINPAVRDWPALRIIDTKKFPHPRTGDKFVVWPLYNLAAGIDDHLMGVTHIIRGKEHFTNMVRQKYMYEYLGWDYPETIHYGRLKITGTFLSKSKIIAGVRDGCFSGWDDPRLATFIALKNRGIQPKSIKKMIIDVGPKTADVTLSWENLYSYNRKILDPISNRYFLVINPISIKVQNVPKIFSINLKLHPQKSNVSSRTYTIIPKGDKEIVSLWIDKKDIENSSKGDTFRLMELFNIKLHGIKDDEIEASYISESYKEARKIKSKFIHWVVKGDEIPCIVNMPDAQIKKGLAESACRKLKPNSIIQFERFGFVRVHENDEELVTYYSHK